MPVPAKCDITNIALCREQLSRSPTAHSASAKPTGSNNNAMSEFSNSVLAKLNATEKTAGNHEQCKSDNVSQIMQERHIFFF